MLDGNLWLRIAGDLRGADFQALIQELYVIERRATDDGCDVTERLRRRQESSVPRMKLLRQELDSLGNQAPPKTPLGVAITYALRQVECAHPVPERWRAAHR